LRSLLSEINQRFIHEKTLKILFIKLKKVNSFSVYIRLANNPIGNNNLLKTPTPKECKKLF